MSEQDGADIHGNLANIVQKLLKDKPEEDKLNEVKKRYLRPKNCEMLAETRVNLAIWNNLSERARTSDLKLQKVQKSLIKGSTAVVQVVNDLISKPDMPSNCQIIKQLMDGVLLMGNANIELNLRRREALKPELHTSYRYLCAPSNPITTELFGDDLPKAVKDSLTPTASLPSLVEKLSRASKDLGVMPIQTDSRANIGIITFGRQKTTAAPPSTRRRGGRRLFKRARTEP